MNAEKREKMINSFILKSVMLLICDFSRVEGAIYMFRQLKILMLEDTEAHQQLMTRMLTRFGIDQVSIAANAADFIDMLAQRSTDFNAFIIDLYLGEGQTDGLEALELVRERGHHQPALLVTMDTTGIDMRKCYALGVTEILDKDQLYEEGVFKAAIRGLNDKVGHEYLMKSNAVMVPIIGEDVHYVPASDILFIQFVDGACKIVTYLDEYTSSVPLKTYAKYLEANDFLIVSKPTLVNMNRVDQFDAVKQTLSLKHDPKNRTVEISDRRMTEVRKYYRTQKQTL